MDLPNVAGMEIMSVRGATPSINQEQEDELTDVAGVLRLLDRERDGLG